MTAHRSAGRSTGLDPPDGQDSPLTRSPRRSVLWLSALLVVAGILCLAIDMPVARFFRAEGTPRDIRDLLARAETFGHAFGVVAILVTVWLVDLKNRRYCFRLAVASLGAGLLANLIKLSVLRVRPRDDSLADGVWSTLVGSWTWNPEGSWQYMMDSAHQSFPSGHTATAAGLAAGLAILYPRAWAWFAMLAVLCGCNRLDTSAHYPSDVCVGAALGLVTAGWAFSRARGTGWITAAETALDRRPPHPVVKSEEARQDETPAERRGLRHAS